MPYIVICIFLVLTTFFIANVGEQIRAPKEIMTIIGFLFIIFSCFKWGNIKGKVTNKWLWFFLIWCLIDSYWLRYKHIAPLGNMQVELIVFNTMMKNLFYIGMSIFTIQVLSNVTTLFGEPMNTRSLMIMSKNESVAGGVDGLMNVISKMALFIACYVLFIQLPGFDQYLRVVGSPELGTGVVVHRLVGTLGNPSIMSTWFAMAVPCVLYKRRWVTLSLVLTCIWLQAGDTGKLAVGAAMLFYLLFTNRKVLYSILSLALVATLFLHGTGTVDFTLKSRNVIEKFVHNDEGRLRVWKKSLEDARDFPLTGHGLGGFQFVEAPRLVPLFTYGDGVMWTNPHNEYIRILFETGITGLFLFLMFCFSVFRRFILSRKTALTITLMSVSVAFLVSSLTLFPMEIPTSAFLMVVVIGLLLNLLNKEESEYV